MEKRSPTEEQEKGRRDTEGGEKVRDTGGFYRTARNKESVSHTRFGKRIQADQVT